MKKDTEKALRRLAGLPVQAKAGRPVSPLPAVADVKRLYVRRGLSLRDAAAELGCTKDAVRRALAEYGLRAHRRVRPSRLAKYGMAELRRRVKASGLLATARELDITAPALLDYMRRHGHKK